MAIKEGVTKTVTVQNVKNFMSTSRGRSTGITYRGTSGVESLTSNYMPYKGDYPDIFLESEDWTIPPFGSPAVARIPKAPRPVSHRKSSWAIVSARSARELKQVLAANPTLKAYSGIQVNDAGRYFIYLSNAPTVAASVDDCVEPVMQKLEDLPESDDSCESDE